MEKDNREIIIKTAFDSINLPEFDAMTDIKARMDKKSPRPFKKAFVAAFVAISVMISGVAAAYYIGSFERLMGIIGERAAALMHPAQGPESLFIGEIITEEGIRAEFVAAGAFDNVVDIFITIEDTVGNRFNCNFLLASITGIEFNIYPADLEPVDGATIFSPQVIHNNNGVITLHGRGIFPFSVAGTELNFEIGRIIYNPTNRRIIYKIDLEAMDIPYEAPTALIGYDKVLKPHQLDYEFGRGVSERISSIGWVDGKLHVQLYNPARSNPWLAFVRAFEHGQGYEQFNNLIYRFDGIDFDEEGNPQRAAWMPFPPYFEIVFDITPEDILEYEFHGTFTGFDYLNLNWNTVFTVGANEQQLVRDGLEFTVGNSLVNEVIVNPSGIRLSGVYTLPREASLLDHSSMFISSTSNVLGMDTNQATWNDISRYYTGDRISVVVRTTDGIHRGILNYFSKNDDESFIHIFGLNNFIDLDTVVSVGIAGQHLILFE